MTVHTRSAQVQSDQIGSITERGQWTWGLTSNQQAVCSWYKLTQRGSVFYSGVSLNILAKVISLAENRINRGRGAGEEPEVEGGPKDISFQKTFFQTQQNWCAYKLTESGSFHKSSPSSHQTNSKQEEGEVNTKSQEASTGSSQIELQH